MKKSYYQFGNERIHVRSKRDVYEKIYLKAIIESYQHVDKSKDLENPLRNRIVWDLQERNPLTKSLFQNEILDIIPERWNYETEQTTRRPDICFHWSKWGKFEVECKRLFRQPSKNKAYLEDGLIRFIELKYAKRNDYAAMIGFVVSGDIEIIKQGIIDNLKGFHASQMPSNNSIIEWEHSIISYHKRSDAREIGIYHLFFEFLEE